MHDEKRLQAPDLFIGDYTYYDNETDLPLLCGPNLEKVKLFLRKQLEP